MAKSFEDLLNGDLSEPKTMDATIKQIAGNVAKNLTAIGSFAVVFAFILIFMFDIDLKTKWTISIAADVIVSTILFQMFRTFQGEEGRKSGKADPDFIESKKRYEEKAKSVSDAGHEQMQAFCDDYVAENLKARRVKILHPVRLDYATYETRYEMADKRAIKADTRLTRKQKAAVLVCNKMTPATLTPDMIVLGDFGSGLTASILTPPSERDKKQVLAGMIITVALAAFTSFLAFDGSIKLTMAKVVYCLLKLCFMLFQGIKERYQKHILYSVDAVRYNDWLSAMIDRYHDFSRRKKEVELTLDKNTVCGDDLAREGYDRQGGQPIGDTDEHHERTVQGRGVRVRDVSENAHGSPCIL
jgi:hypothetical protein